MTVLKRAGPAGLQNLDLCGELAVVLQGVLLHHVSRSRGLEHLGQRPVVQVQLQRQAERCRRGWTTTEPAPEPGPSGGGYHGGDALLSFLVLLRRLQEVLEDFVVSRQLQNKQVQLLQVGTDVWSDRGAPEPSSWVTC